MSQYLLYGRYKWINKKDSDNFDVNSIGEDSSDGYILDLDLELGLDLRVDIEYPDELHKLHNDCPLA